MTSVLVVDDQPLIRTAVRALLSAAGDIEVSGEASDGVAALEQAGARPPDVVLTDIRMPRMDGIELTRRICADPLLAKVRVLILTTFEEDEYVFASLRAGASGFIGKGSEPEDIVRAVRAVHAGETLLSPGATRTLIERHLNRGGRPARRDTLTAREHEVLLMVARGLSNADIADELVISPFTAKTHVNRIMTKLEVRDRAQLVIHAYETGLVVPERPPR